MDVEGAGELDDIWIPPRDLFICVAIIYNLLTSERNSSQLAKSQNTGRNPIWKSFDVKITLNKVAHPEFLAWFLPPCLIHFSRAIARWFFFKANLAEQLTHSEMLWFYFGLCSGQRFWLWCSHPRCEFIWNKMQEEINVQWSWLKMK